jgi:hypothetical protein
MGVTTSIVQSLTQTSTTVAGTPRQLTQCAPEPIVNLDRSKPLRRVLSSPIGRARSATAAAETLPHQIQRPQAKNPTSARSYDSKYNNVQLLPLLNRVCIVLICNDTR